MELLDHLLGQGVSREVALELAERKQKNPSLVSVVVGGRYISLTPKRSAEKANQMLESGVPPGTSGTDRAFLEGEENGRFFQNKPEMGEFYKKQAAKCGKKISRGHVYKASLARFPGDPRAWVSDLGEAKKVIAQRELDEVKKEAAGPSAEVDVADAIVDRQMCVELAGQTVTGREYKDKREKVKARMKPSWKK